MNSKVFAILAALCAIAAGCVLSYYQIEGEKHMPAKPAAAAQTAAGKSDDARNAGSDNAAPASETHGRRRPRSVTAGQSGSAEDRASSGSGASTVGWHGTAGGQPTAFAQLMQSFAVQVENVVGVARLVSPGMPVEVLVSAHPPGSDARQGAVTRTVLRNIQVLSAGSYLEKNPQGASRSIERVNLQVTPQQAVTMSQADAQSGMLLVLRNPVGAVVYELPATAMSDSTPQQQSSGAKPVRGLQGSGTAPPGSFYAVQVIDGSKSGGSTFNTVVFPLPEGMQ